MILVQMSLGDVLLRKPPLDVWAPIDWHITASYITVLKDPTFEMSHVGKRRVPVEKWSSYSMGTEIQTQ